jgi:hypothetical protein
MSGNRRGRETTKLNKKFRYGRQEGRRNGFLASSNAHNKLGGKYES